MNAILDRVVERAVLDEHDGRSGARLERVRLDDGTRLVVKYADPTADLTIALTGGVERERLMWSSGTTEDRLPLVREPVCLAADTAISAGRSGRAP
jgi:hypothetical protein